MAIYVTVEATHRLEDPKALEAQYRRIASQLRFDKVYVETYRSGQFADEAALASLKRFFTAHGIAVSGGIAWSVAGHGGQFSTLVSRRSYSKNGTSTLKRLDEPRG